jgi:DNA-3-methyladenine glycosylase I
MVEKLLSPTSRKEDLMEDGRVRCDWSTSSDDLLAYHDAEWGFGVDDDARLFEKLCLEGFQSGLSWLTILRKRDNFRAAFAGFDIAIVAGFDEADVARLMRDAGIVRHEKKIRSAINNAHRALELRGERGSLAAYFWELAACDLPPQGLDQAVTPASTALSKDLKRRGWSFVGPTTVYAFMQAVGLVNDHDDTCWARQPAERSRREIAGRFL